MSTSTGLGARLRAEREAKGVGLEELSRATKIRRVLLEALEEERWQDLPSRVFLVGYLRAVASHLRLDSRDLVAELDRARGSAEATSDSAPCEEGTPRTSADRSFQLPVLVAVLAVIGVASVALWLAFGLGEGAGASVETPRRAAASLDDLSECPQPAAFPGGFAEGPAPLAEPSVSPVAASQPNPPLGTAEAPRGTRTREPSAVVRGPETESLSRPVAKPRGDLFLDVAGPCWMVLFRGEDRLVYREVRAGEQLSFEGGPFTLTLGDASAVKAFWKGRPIPLPQKPGSVVKEMRLGEVSDESPGR